MRLQYLLSLLCIGLCTVLSAQPKEITTRYYFATEDFIHDRLSAEEILITVIEMGNGFIYARDILDPATRKKSSMGSKAWAIAYDSSAYVNLKYSNNANAPELFIRIDLKGRFCLSIMDLEFMESLDKAEHYSGPLKIYNHDSRTTTDAKYYTEAGELKRIFLIDTNDLSIVLPYKAKNAPADLLTKATLKWLVGKENYKGSQSHYTVEDVIQIVEDLNQRQKT